MTIHELSIEATTDVYERLSGLNFYGECSCSNHDSNGDGGAYWYGADKAEVIDQYDAHLVGAA